MVLSKWLSAETDWVLSAAAVLRWDQAIKTSPSNRNLRVKTLVACVPPSTFLSHTLSILVVLEDRVWNVRHTPIFFHLLFSINFFLDLFMCVGVWLACMYVYHLCAWKSEVRRGHQIWNWSYRWLALQSHRVGAGN